MWWMVEAHCLRLTQLEPTSVASIGFVWVKPPTPQMLGEIIFLSNYFKFFRLQ
jgi:hypothetical protein